jgi:hypothetical protein
MAHVHWLTYAKVLDVVDNAKAESRALYTDVFFKNKDCASFRYGCHFNYSLRVPWGKPSTVSVARCVLPGPQPWVLHVMTHRPVNAQAFNLLGFLVTLKATPDAWKLFLKTAAQKPMFTAYYHGPNKHKSQLPEYRIVGPKDDVDFVSAEVAALSGMKGMGQRWMSFSFMVQEEGENDAQWFLSSHKDAFVRLPLDATWSLLLSCCLQNVVIDPRPSAGAPNMPTLRAVRELLPPSAIEEEDSKRMRKRKQVATFRDSLSQEQREAKREQNRLHKRMKRA